MTQKTTTTQLKNIGSLIRSQDNRCTDQPIFVVEQCVMVVTHPDYDYDRAEWINPSKDYEIASETKARRLDILEEHYRDTGHWRKIYTKETWQFVTACFTEQGCKDYLDTNRHNLNKARICAYGSFRNREYQTLRNFLIDLATPPEPLKKPPRTEEETASLINDIMSFNILPELIKKHSIQREKNWGHKLSKAMTANSHEKLIAVAIREVCDSEQWEKATLHLFENSTGIE